MFPPIIIFTLNITFLELAFGHPFLKTFLSAFVSEKVYEVPVFDIFLYVISAFVLSSVMQACRVVTEFPGGVEYLITGFVSSLKSGADVRLAYIECKKFNIMHYERFRSELINCGKLKLVSKNDKLKILRTLLNYGRRRQVVSPNNAKRNYYISSLKTTSSNRKLSLTSDLITDLLELQKTQTVFDNYTDEFFVFGSDYAIMPMGHREPQKRKREIANRAGVKEIRLHDFRHSCASMLLSKGVPIPTVSKYMGHASVTETLNTYSHSLTSDFEGVSDVIERVF